MLIASLLAAALSTASPGINLQSDTRPLRDVSPAQENVSADAVTPACKTQPVEASGPAPTPKTVPIPVVNRAIYQPPAGFTILRNKNGGETIIAQDGTVTEKDANARTLNFSNSGTSNDGVFRPGENPEDGLYAPVLKIVDGCEMSTPVSGNLQPKIVDPATATPADAPQNKN